MKRKQYGEFFTPFGDLVKDDIMSLDVERVYYTAKPSQNDKFFIILLLL